MSCRDFRDVTSMFGISLEMEMYILSSASQVGLHWRPPGQTTTTTPIQKTFDGVKRSGKFAILYLYKIGEGRGSGGTFWKIEVQDSIFA